MTTTSSDDHSLYFDVQADFGITKHMGGRKATQELADLCHIQPGSKVLEIGCGIGYTACYLVKTYGCQLSVIDISEKMIARAQQRAHKQGLAGKIDFRAADAQALPFDPGSFDAVIDESVTAFVPDQLKAVREYARVTRPGGYVGLNEVTWVRPPLPEVAQYAAFIMARANFHVASGWEDLIDCAGLQERTVKIHPFNAIRQWQSELQSLDLGEYTAAWKRFLTQMPSNPAYQKFTRQVFTAPGNIFKFMKSIGYGLYVGRMPQS